MLAALPACGKGCGADAGGAPPLAINIPVTVDGADGAPLDAALLERIRPDFVDGDRRAWRLRTLLGPLAERPGTVIEVEDEEGARTVLSGGAEQEDGREAVLAVNRTGEVRAARVRPEDPFPPFHGRGGNRGRGGDPTRIREVRHVWVRLAAAPSGAGSAAGVDAGVMEPDVALHIEIDALPAITWTRDDLDKVPRIELPQEGTDEHRYGWSLREVARVLVGPDAAAIEVQGTGGKSARIDAAAWRDTTRVPVLRGNRRGLLKFQWLDDKLAPLDLDKVRAVAGLRFSRVAAPAPSR